MSAMPMRYLCQWHWRAIERTDSRIRRVGVLSLTSITVRVGEVE